MCGRMTLYDLDHVKTWIYKTFNIDMEDLDIKENYNITPKTDLVSIIYDGKSFRAGIISWGLMIQSKEKSFLNINARRETIKTYPYFKNLSQNKRILIVLKGYYEWQDQGDYKTPYYLFQRDETVMFAAGVYDKIDGQFGVSILTEAASIDLKHIHDRMPTLLTKEEAILYLKEGVLPLPSVKTLKYHQVSHEVNLKSSNHYKLIEPYDAFSDV
jgi:putative SOS response-associated peptidase YedK